MRFFLKTSVLMFGLCLLPTQSIANTQIIKIRNMCHHQNVAKNMTVRMADNTCKKAGGTDSAPVCGGTCDNGGLCDISYDSNSRPSCACS
jgi:hypothetical protein